MESVTIYRNELFLSHYNKVFKHLRYVRKHIN